MNIQLSIVLNTRFAQKVSGLTTVHEVDKAYVGFNPNCLQHSSLPQLHTSPNVSTTVGNILRTPLSGCLIVSSSNFVRCPPLPQIGVLSELSYGLGIGKSQTVRDLVSMASTATERCRV